jgi:hypothetical protein
MKRTGAFLVAVSMSGCMMGGSGPHTAGNGGPCCGQKHATVPGVQGPWGQPVPVMAPYSPPASAKMSAKEAKSPAASGVMPAVATAKPGAPSGVVQATHHGGGTIAVPPPPYGAVAAAGALMPGMHAQMPAKRTEVRFLGPDGMRVRWMSVGPDGRPVASSQALSVPGRYNFLQAAIYRLKLDIPREDLPALYPTLEVVPSNARTDAYLAHSAVPVVFTNEDFDQVKAGNYVVKVIYLPDPQFQDLATAGPEEIVSTRLEPGADPIAEAHRRGSILLVVRMGNVDLELPHSPPLTLPAGPFGPGFGMPNLPGAPVAKPTPKPARAGGLFARTPEPATDVQQAGAQPLQPVAMTPAATANPADTAAAIRPANRFLWWSWGKK